MDYRAARQIISDRVRTLRQEQQDPEGEALADILEVAGECVVDVAESLHDLADTQAGR
jgi:hypothetical protein